MYTPRTYFCTLVMQRVTWSGNWNNETETHNAAIPGEYEYRVICPHRPPNSVRLILESPPSKYLPSLPPPLHPPGRSGTHEVTVPRPSHLDPANLTCPSAPIIFDKIKSKHVFYSYKLFNDFLALDRNPEVVKI